MNKATEAIKRRWDHYRAKVAELEAENERLRCEVQRQKDLKTAWEAVANTANETVGSLVTEKAALRKQVEQLAELVEDTFRAFGPTLTVGWTGSITHERLAAIMEATDG